MYNQSSGLQKQLLNGQQLSPLGIHVFDAERQPKSNNKLVINKINQRLHIFVP